MKAALLLSTFTFSLLRCFAQTTLEELERMVLAANPAIAQAEADVRAAQGRAKQAGLYPNPVIGATGDHNTPALNGGSLGGFAEQRIVTGSKLRLARKAAELNREALEQMQAATRLRLLIQVRTLFYRGLGEQRRVEVRKSLADVARRTASTVAELNNTGQADRPDFLAAEVEAQRAELAVRLAQNALDRTRREIAALANREVMSSTLQGDLESLPKIDAAQALTRVLNETPELRAEQLEAGRAGTLVQAARAARIPDISVRGGLRYNREPVERSIPLSAGVGNEGFFDVGVEVPLFNRNQGAIAAAEADAAGARVALERRVLELRQRFAAVYREYADASSAAERYRTEMLPRAREAFELYANNFRQMAVSYPQVLAAQRNLIQLEDDYITQLIAAWQAAVEIDGLLVE
jgi:cobalt-zinc-cadmium efflux system outer membrane protein